MAQSLVWRPWDFHHTYTNLSPVGSDDASPLPESCDTSPIPGSHNDSFDTDSCHSSPNHECCHTSLETEEIPQSSASDSSPKAASIESSPNHESCHTSTITGSCKISLTPKSYTISPSSESNSSTKAESIEHLPNHESCDISPVPGSCKASLVTDSCQSSPNQGNSSISKIPGPSSSSPSSGSETTLLLRSTESSPSSSSGVHSSMSGGEHSSPESSSYNPHYLAPQSHFSRSPLLPRSLPGHNDLPISLHFNQIHGHNISPRFPLYNQLPVPATTCQHLPSHYSPVIFPPFPLACAAIHTTTRPIYQPPTTRPIYQPPTNRPIYQPPTNLYFNVMPPPAAFIPDLRNLHLLQSVACNVQPFYPIPSPTPYKHMPQYTRSIQVDEPLDLTPTALIKQEINDSNINQVQRHVPDPSNNGHQQYDIHINTSYHQLLKQEIVTDEEATISYDDDMPHEEEEDDFIIDVVTCDNEDQKSTEDIPDQKKMEDIPDQRVVEHHANQLTTVCEAPATTDQNTADDQTVTKTEDDVTYQMKTEHNTEGMTVVVELHVPSRKRKGDNTDNKCSTAKQTKKDNSSKREKVMPYGDHELHVLNIKFDSANKQRFCDEKGNYMVPKIPEDQDSKQELKSALLDLFANSNLPKFPEQLKHNLQNICYFPYMTHLLSLHQDGVDIQTLKFSSNGFSFQNPQLAALGEEKFNQLLDSMYQTDGDGIMHCCVPRSVDDGALCGHVTKERGKMKRHCKVHFPHKKWVCCFCRAQMFDTTDMDRHTPLHTGLKPYNCTQCGTQYAQKISLVSHIKRYHS